MMEVCSSTQRNQSNTTLFLSPDQPESENLSFSEPIRYCMQDILISQTQVREQSSNLHTNSHHAAFAVSLKWAAQSCNTDFKKTSPCRGRSKTKLSIRFCPLKTACYVQSCKKGIGKEAFMQYLSDIWTQICHKHFIKTLGKKSWICLLW